MRVIFCCNNYIVRYSLLLTIILADNWRQQYIGCYRDGGPADRVMESQRTNESMTVDWCQHYCQRSTYTYFGLEVTLCDNVLLQVSTVRCIRPIIIYLPSGK